MVSKLISLLKKKFHVQNNKVKGLASLSTQYPDLPYKIKTGRYWVSQNWPNLQLSQRFTKQKSFFAEWDFFFSNTFLRPIVDKFQTICFKKKKKIQNIEQVASIKIFHTTLHIIEKINNRMAWQLWCIKQYRLYIPYPKCLRPECFKFEVVTDNGFQYKWDNFRMGHKSKHEIHLFHIYLTHLKAILYNIFNNFVQVSNEVKCGIFHLWHQFSPQKVSESGAFQILNFQIRDA